MDFLKTNKYNAGFIFILLTAGFFSLWGIWNEGWGNAYYSAAVKSMLTSWHNFFYASFDPAGYVSVDKPAIGLWLQCLSVLIFGFKGWALILPQALASIASVGILYKMIEKPFGKIPGLLAGLFLAVTPIFIAVGRTNNLDATLIFCITVAAYFLLKGLNEGKFTFVLLSTAIVGLGFNVKMIQAYMILPSIYLTYLILAKVKIGKRIVNLTFATIVLLAISLSWCVAVDLTPKDQRPYVGSSSNNSALNLAFGYNGIMRAVPAMGVFGELTSGPVSGSQNTNVADDKTEPSIAAASSTSAVGAGNLFSSGNSGFARLLNKQLGGQIGWLFPLGLIGLAAICINSRTVFLTYSIEKRSALLFWGSLFIVMYLYFSFGGIVHGYYTATAAPAISAMASLGIYEMWHLFKGSAWVKWLLPVSIFITGIAQFVLLERYSDWNGWLSKVVLTFSILAAAALAISKIVNSFNEQNIQKPLLSLGIVVLLISPAIWSFTPIVYGMTSSLPSAGPELSSTYSSKTGGFKFPNTMPGDRKLEAFLLKNYVKEKYIVAAPSAILAEMMIIDTGKAVMAVGGFIGNDKILTVEKLKDMVNKNELRYFLMMDTANLPAQASGTANQNGYGSNPPFSQILVIMSGQKEISDWVKANGTIVPDKEWRDIPLKTEPTMNNSAAGGFEKMFTALYGGVKLYDLKPGNNS